MKSEGLKLSRNILLNNMSYFTWHLFHWIFILKTKKTLLFVFNLSCASRIVVFIVKKCFIGKLNSSLVEIYKKWRHKYLKKQLGLAWKLACTRKCMCTWAYKGHNPWDTVYMCGYKITSEVCEKLWHLQIFAMSLILNLFKLA
jgi:hypothetical protein